MSAAPPRLPEPSRQALERLLAVLAADPTAPTSVADLDRARQVHLADSLSGLAFGELRDAARLCDVGAGAGFPGLVLAAALPEAEVDLVESIGRKCRFIERAAAASGLDRNARVVCARAESWAAGAGRGRYDAVVIRAVGRLATLAELASPLLRDGGALVAWKGRRDADEEAELTRAAEALAMRPEEIRWVGPYAGSRNRHLHLIRKHGPTPDRLPRRPGIAKKRPLGA